jgi:hypothetical protein
VETIAPREPVLEYDATPRRRGWWRQKRYALIALALVAAGTLFHYRQEISARTRRWYWTRECMTFVIAPQTKLIESDPQRIGELAQGGASGDYIITTTNAQLKRAAYVPRCWRELCLVDARGYQLRGAISTTNPAPIVFLHERTSPSGERRLVIVTGDWTNALDLEKYTDAIALAPAKPLDSLAPQLKFQKMFAYSGAYVKAELHPGIADAVDSSHFTIPYDAQGKRHTLHGYLQDDGTLKFTKE